MFEKLENISLKNYGSCTSHYFIASGLSWDAMLKIIKNKLDRITDPDRYILFENSTGDGVSYISNRYSKVSNTYLKPYDPREETKHIVYLDTNNLYGYAMSTFPWTSVFKWIDPKEFDLNEYTSNRYKWCVPEVDLEYSNELWLSFSSR